jgi:hypothetical protein
MDGQIRQGDVLLIPVEVLPPAGRRGQPEVVLAEGEVTGHAHRLAGGEVLDWSVAGQRYVRVEGDQPGTLAHEDHDPIPAAVLTPGVTYRVIRQQSASFLADEWVQVKD